MPIRSRQCELLEALRFSKDFVGGRSVADPWRQCLRGINGGIRGGIHEG